jgi:hypothetical protein
MSQNNAMVNNTGSIIYCDTIEFQENLKSNMNVSSIYNNIT